MARWYRLEAVDERFFTSAPHFAEDYVVEATPTGSRFTWTIALTPAPWARAPMRLIQWTNPMVFGLLPRAARRYFAANP